jgi:L,D-transpeptidase ErfK/SrfK
VIVHSFSNETRHAMTFSSSSPAARLAAGTLPVNPMFRPLRLAAVLGLVAVTSPLIGLRAAVAETAVAETAVAETATTAEVQTEAIDTTTIADQELTDADMTADGEAGHEVAAGEFEVGEFETSEFEVGEFETSEFDEFEVIPFGQGLPNDRGTSIASDLPEDPATEDPATPAAEPTPPIETPPTPTFQRKVETRLQLDLSDRRLSLYADNELVGSYTVAVGKPGWETPTGDYSILHMAIDPIWENPWTGELIYPGPTNPMGRAVIVFHTIGDDMIAFHGTPDEGLLGQAVSHGCVRMRNEDILAMYDIVRRGTPVSVVP